MASYLTTPSGESLTNVNDPKRLRKPRENCEERCKGRTTSSRERAPSTKGETTKCPAQNNTKRLNAQAAKKVRKRNPINLINIRKRRLT